MRISIVRHGATAANAAGLLQGRTDNPLNETGQKQAEQIAQALCAAAIPVDHVISSPLDRAVNTAAPLLGATGLELEIEARWIELNYGDWEQKPSKDVPAQDWQQWRADKSFAPPGGESLPALTERVMAACDDLVAAGQDREYQHVAVFTHVSPIKAAIAWALGADLDAGVAMSWRMHVAQAQISTVQVSANPVSTNTPARPLRLTAFNATDHLSG